MLCIVFLQTCSHGQFHMELQTKQYLINYHWNIPSSHELLSEQQSKKSSKPALSCCFINLPYRNGAPPASRYRLCFLGLIQHSAIPNSPREAAACSTFTMAGKDEFGPWSVWAELAGTQAQWMRNRHRQQHRQCTHKRCLSSAIAMCPCLRHGGWQEQTSLPHSVKKALKRRGVGGKTQPDPTAIPSTGLQLQGWLCRAAVVQFI